MTRDEAIRKVEYGLEMETTEQTTFGQLTVVSTEALKMALAALREPERGEWVGTADGYADGELVYDMWECSECGYDADGADEKPEWNFCPHCGADMRPEGGAEG